MQEVYRDSASESVDAAAHDLLRTAVAEKQDLNLKRAFRLLGLTYSAEDMYSAYLGHASGDRSTRASALEFLDNVLHREEKELLMPFLDMSSRRAAIAHGEHVFGTRISNRNEAIGFLLQGADSWLRACALYSLGGAAVADFGDAITRLRADSHPVVRETAELVVGAT